MAINPKGIAIVITGKKRPHQAHEEESMANEEADDGQEEVAGEISPEIEQAANEMYNAIKAEDRERFAHALNAALEVCKYESADDDSED